LSALNGRIEVEAASVLAAGIDRELAAQQRAADRLNIVMASLMGLKFFLIRQGAGNLEFLRIAERISAQLAMPDIGATKQEIEASSAQWAQRFEELANG